MTQKPTIEVREIGSSAPVHCPFCNHEAYPGDDKVTEGWQLPTPCEHMLFMATDGGFEYRSSRFNQHMGLPDNQDPEPEFPEEHESAGFDAFTSTVRIPGAVKFASYVPAPSFFGAYFGFAPSEPQQTP